MTTGTPLTPYTYTDLANRAIAKLGGLRNTPRIADIDDSSNAVAVAVKAMIPHVRKEVLATPPEFKESVRYGDCGGEDTSVETADWEYAFEVPSGSLRVIHQTIQTNRTITIDHERIGQHLFTNEKTNEDQDNAFVKYVYDLEDTTKWSPLLFETVATKLAAEVAPHLGQGQLRQAMLAEYEQMVRKRAIEANAADGYDKASERGNTNWADARFK